MEKLTLSSTPSSTIPSSFLSHSLPIIRASRRRVSFYPRHNPKNFSVFASKNNPDDELSQWDLMELKFGQMIGEDPKLTIAKIKGRKANPDASYIEIEKNFYKNKGKLVEVKEVPFDVPEKRALVKETNGLNLVKPVPKKGIKVGGGDDNSKLPEIKRPVSNGLNLVKPVPKKGTEVGVGEDNSKLLEIKRPSQSIRNKESSVTKSSVPNVILRKPSVFNEEDDETDSLSRLRIKPNLSLLMRTEPLKEKFSGMTLLKRPEPVNVNEDHGDGNENSVMNGSVYGGGTNGATKDFEGDRMNGVQSSMTISGDLTLLEKPNAIMQQNAEGKGSSYGPEGTASMVGDHFEGLVDSKSVPVSKQDELCEDSQREMQHCEQTDVGCSGEERKTYKNSTVGSSGSEPLNSSLLGRPKRLDRSVKEMSYPPREEAVSGSAESFDGEEEQDKLPVTRPLKETEEIDWRRVEQSFNLGHRIEVELVSCSPRGFVVSYGSLIGFLPYRNLAAKWKFLAFESWLRKNGLDPSKYRQNLGIIGNDEFQNKSTSLESSLFPEVGQKAKLELTADMKLEELLRIYDLEKIQYLSSYLSQQIKVNILLADRNSKKLIFSMRPKEKDELVERKRSLMAKLNIGDVVKCCIKKITYFGIFVEVEDVPALIHQTEVSWDSTLDPSSYLKIGQIVEAKVYQLDFALERIFLSLKEITPDPLNEALECIVGNNSFNDALEAAQADTEWAEVDSLIKELQEIEGIETVTKGRFFLSPGLAPTFQVYMASMFENQYKLLARAGNRVQEIMVQASLEKEEMKSVILKCTNRVDV